MPNKDKPQREQKKAKKAKKPAPEKITEPIRIPATPGGPPRDPRR